LRQFGLSSQHPSEILESHSSAQKGRSTFIFSYRHLTDEKLIDKEIRQFKISFPHPLLVTAN
jgi:hypothetical protein